MIKALLALALVLSVEAQQLFNCPDQWYSNENKCYRFVAYPRSNYEGASATCREDGAMLLSVNTIAEHSFIVNWLETNDQRRDEWFTSGSVTVGATGGVRWNGDGTFSRGFSFWLNETSNQEDGARVVYAFSGNNYGWGVTRTTGTLSFICEIDQTEAYRIVQENRDFDYGFSTENPNDIPRGPKFLVEPSDTTILGSTTAVFMECVAHAVPNPKYQWYRIVGNQTFPLDATTDNRYTLTNGRLTINNPTSRDESYYQCKAENYLGTVLSRTGQLSFGDLGEFSNVGVAPTVTNEYEGAQLNCPPITVKPAAKYQWYKNNVANFIRPSLQSYIFISNNGKLYFSEVTRTDEGRYHCIVSLTSIGGTSNYVGSSQNPSKSSLGFNLDVVSQAGGNYRPIIQDDFISVFPSQPKKGQDIQLECFAYGTGPLVYQWSRLLGKDMPSRARYSDHNRVLTIMNVAPEDQGVYKCRVYSSTTKEADEKGYSLRIESEPYFTYPLKDQHTDVGGQLTWHCEAGGTPPPTYLWYKDGVPLKNMTGVLTIHRNALTVQGLNKERDSGMYQCSATNQHNVMYSTAQLRVLEFAPSFTKHPLQRGIAASMGGNVTIVCDPEAAPAPDYEWLKDGRNLGLTKGGDSGNYKMLMNGNLYITSLRTSDRGRYTCKVTNPIGSAEDSAELTIVSQTVLTRRPSSEDVLVNSTATLSCEASASQNMDMVYSWKFNNHLIDVEKNPYYRLGSGFTRGYLYVISAQFIHAGKYTCNAATGLDIQSAEATLKVLGPPGEPAGVFQDLKATDSSNPRSIKIMWTDGDTHGADVLYYDVEFHTNFNRQWRILKERIPSTEALDDLQPSKRQTTLMNLKSGAGYQFRVRAMNRYGLGLPSVPTTTIQIPSDKPAKAPEKVGGGGGKVGDLTITWEPLSSEDHNGMGLGYNVFWRKKPVGGSQSKWETEKLMGPSKGSFVTLVGLENFYSEYEVQVQAFNNIGSGNRSHIALIRSAEDLPIGTPSSVYADSYNSTSLMVFWTPVPNNKKYMKGKLIGYKVNYWRQQEETEIEAVQSIYEGQIDHALIIGLQPDTWYTVNVQVYNSAGNGPKSEDYHQSTDRMAPQLYPTEVHVFSHSSTQVSVSFRGVSTQVYEEPLQGYKVQYWRYAEDIRKAKMVDTEKNSQAILGNIEKGIIYQMRVFAYSRGGQGKMSSPATLFTLGGEVRIDSSTTNIMAGSASVIPAMLVTAISLLAALLFTIRA
ncbi:contactin-like [Haliotis rufescens]|uniref:contactin-like n=1 Tax=Haliotis rufescens TaxID=6454 RepID=UPI001EB0A1B7|nr:contactin-like [Haliotis rufescens]